MLSSSRLPVVDKSGSASALLAALANLSQQQFADEQELVTAILNVIAEQLHVRTPFLSATLTGKFEILDLVNNRGCTLRAGDMLPLTDSY